MIVNRWIGLILCSLSPMMCLAGDSPLGPSDLRSPLTVKQTSRGTIPLITASGADTNIPLAIRPKGHSFLQLGPDTYGASGWSGADLGTEYFNLNTATPFSFGNYIEITAGDFPNGSVYGTSMFIYSKLAPTNTPHQLIGLDINTFPQLAPGQTMWQGVGTQSQTETYNAGTVQFAYGVAGYATAKDNSHIDNAIGVNSGVTSSETGSISNAVNYFATLGEVTTTPGTNGGELFLGTLTNSVTMGSAYGLYFTDFAGHATNGYYEWFDSRGVFNVRDNGVTNYYNPSFTKYVVGASSYERSVQQWNSNVLEYGTQAGGTGTLRGVKILGASLQTPDLTAPTIKLTPGSEPSSPSEGMIYANSIDHHLYFYNGTTWKQLDN